MSTPAHLYGPNLVLHGEPYPLSILARLGHPDCTQPEVGRLATRLYEYLFTHIANAELGVARARVRTRMTKLHPGQHWRGEVVRQDQRVVVVDVARAGILGAQIFYNQFNELLSPANVRQDHLFVGRVTDEAGRVTGSEIRSAKIGGPVDEAMLVIPDPMGATGGSLCEVLRHYARTGAGIPRKVVFAHLIVTPEYLRRVATELPTARVHAIRVDRGLSTPRALAALPGRFPDEERGLDEHQYIVPGAGGLGEVLNNAWV